MGITVEASGSFTNTLRFLQRLKDGTIYRILDKYGPLGVQALSAATPVETGVTEFSWNYRLWHASKSNGIAWYNTHIEEGVPIALVLQYGHGTGTGGYVPGRDYINPAMRPIFEQLLAEVRRVVTA